MATVIGTSGSVRAVKEEAAALGLAFGGDNLDKLDQLEKELSARLSDAVTQAGERYREELHALEVGVSAARDLSEGEIEALLHSLEQGARIITDRIVALRSVPSRLLRLVNLAKILGHLFLGWLLRRRAHRQIRAIRERVSRHDAEVLAFRQDSEGFIARQVQPLIQQHAAARALLASPSAAGARAELAVIDALRSLPSEYTVLNDVCLPASKFMRLHGKPIRSAQLDHVVVSVGGIFVIETKYWSQQFLERGDFMNPFEQVRRAGYLCHRLLKEEGLPCRVRNVLVSKGALPPKAPEDFVKVLTPDKLAGYFRWFKPELSTDDVFDIIRFLEGWVATDG